eukprot:c10135_g2_i1.p1 GENE.c10135_g2_i1~~c10135_g2_i1.p1  ORF type:complete len:283 (-),score=79.51 c10135_g2_i1:390-1187(-)
MLLVCRTCIRAAANFEAQQHLRVLATSVPRTYLNGPRQQIRYFSAAAGSPTNPTQPEKEKPALEVFSRSEADKNWFLRLLGFYSKESTLSRQASVFVILAKDQSENVQFFENLGLPQTFQTKYMVAGLHIWMIWHRIRSVDTKEGQELGAAMFDLFWEQTTKEITSMGVTYMQLNKQLTELQHMFFGNSRRLDKALQDNDNNEFKAALQKNIFLGEGSDKAVESLYTYLMQAMYALEMLDSEALLSGYFVWGLPQSAVSHKKHSK